MKKLGIKKSTWKRIGTYVLTTCFVFISNIAHAIEPTEVQLDKLTVQQLQQAAEAGDPDAQYALGYMYYYGKRVPQNTQEAMQWIKRASVQGQEQAVKAMALLSGTNSPQKTSPPNQDIASTATSSVNTKNASTEPAKSASSNVAAKSSTTEPTVSNTTTTTLSSTAGTGKMTSFNGINSLVPQGQQLLDVPSSYHTVQLLGSSSEKEVLAYINANQLQGKVAYYRGDNKGKDWYVVLYGLYKTRSEAQAAVSGLPESLKKKNPWVKSMASVQSSIKDRVS